MRVLRSPGGCPWDREQTLKTLRPFVLEETYEVLQALDHDDRRALREELGDFIFEAVLLAQVCAETRRLHRGRLPALHLGQARPAASARVRFRQRQRTDASAGRPHPTTPDEVVERWEAMKASEKSSTGEQRTTLGGVPRSCRRSCAPTRSACARRRSASTGNAPRTSSRRSKKRSPSCAPRSVGGRGTRQRAEEEMGDLLFAIANLSRKLGIEPESALRQANDKFTRRFSAMEARLRAAGRPLSECSLQEMEDEWARVKAAERERPAARTQDQRRPVNVFTSTSGRRFAP